MSHVVRPISRRSAIHRFDHHCHPALALTLAATFDHPLLAHPWDFHAAHPMRLPAPRLSPDAAAGFGHRSSALAHWHRHDHSTLYVAGRNPYPTVHCQHPFWGLGKPSDTLIQFILDTFSGVLTQFEAYCNVRPVASAHPLTKRFQSCNSATQSSSPWPSTQRPQKLMQHITQSTGNSVVRVCPGSPGVCADRQCHRQHQHHRHRPAHHRTVARSCCRRARDPRRHRQPRLRHQRSAVGRTHPQQQPPQGFQGWMVGQAQRRSGTEGSRRSRTPRNPRRCTCRHCAGHRSCRSDRTACTAGCRSAADAGCRCPIRRTPHWWRSSRRTPTASPTLRVA